jgi:flavin-dependent dehydrogenase
MYDAIVVGARAAGAPTAMLLARKGYRVLLVDMATFPSDALGNNLMKPPAILRLQRWGLLDEVIACGCPALRRVNYDYYGDYRFIAVPPPLEGVNTSYGPRRRILDKIMLDAAWAAGAELREGFAIEELIFEGERVTGIRGHARGGATVAETAPFVIGADGRNSLVARAVQASSYNERAPLACYYYSYWSGVSVDEFEAYFRPERVALAVPTNDGLTCVIAGAPQRQFHAFRADIEGTFWQTLALAPRLYERVSAGHREERFVGAGNLANYLRTPYGPGWALVGDAGLHRDPLTANGSSDAYRDVELLVDAVDAGLSGVRPMEEALAEYEQRRNEAALPFYELTCQRATLAPPAPKTLRLFAALATNQEAANRFAGVTYGTIPVGEFFAPANVQRIVAAIT